MYLLQRRENFQLYVCPGKKGLYKSDTYAKSYGLWIMSLISFLLPFESHQQPYVEKQGLAQFLPWPPLSSSSCSPVSFVVCITRLALKCFVFLVTLPECMLSSLLAHDLATHSLGSVWKGLKSSLLCLATACLSLSGGNEGELLSTFLP